MRQQRQCGPVGQQDGDASNCGGGGGGGGSSSSSTSSSSSSNRRTNCATQRCLQRCNCGDRDPGRFWDGVRRGL